MEFLVLGPLAVVDGRGAAVEIRGAKLRTLLGVLVVNAGRPVSADQLAETLWGDRPPAGVANSLQAQISKLRKQLSATGETAPLETRDGGYVLTVAAAAVDAARFTEAAAKGHALLAAGSARDAASTLREALATWRGAPLEDFAYDDFAAAERVRLAELRLTALEDRFDAELALGEHDALVPEIEAALSASPLRERLWGQLMIALYRGGRQGDAIRAYQRARERLADELGLDPGPELQLLERRLLDQDPSLQAPRSPPTVAARLTNVLPEISTFVGREAELSGVDALVRQRRLVTLTGPGGVGKTRLATEIALRGQSAWRDGTWLVELGAGAGDGAVADAVVRTFGPRLGRVANADDGVGALHDWLLEGLSSSELLIVLDNCEHVLGAAATTVAALLRGCPGVHVLATSREPLGVPGEMVRPLEPLDLDDAVALFASRAADSSASFVLDARSAPVVESICTRVDRLPLAIELTAARTRAFSTEQIVELLADRFALVSASGSARPPRQQTLHAAVGWSYELLFDDERRLLDRLSVFSGGFPLEGAVSVCADVSLRAADVEVLLARLVDKSLVGVDPTGGGAGRFRLLQAVADFATARLDATGERDRIRDRHLAWLVEMTAGATAGLRSPDKLVWAHRLNAEIPNITAAGRWAVTGGDVESGLQLSVNLGWYAFLSANLHDDESTLLTLLDRAPDAPPALRCRAMTWAGLLAIGRTGERTWALDTIDVARTASTISGTGDRPGPEHQHQAMAMRAVDEARRIGEPRLVADACAFAALHLAGVGTDPSAVRALVAEGRESAAEIRDEWTLALLDGIDGLATYIAGDLAPAARQLTDVIVRLRALGDEGGAAMFEISLDEVIELSGDLDGAAAAIERAFLLGRAGGFQSSMILHSILCWLTVRRGDAARALELGRDAVAAAHRPFNPVTRAQALFALGAAELLNDLVDDAADHLGEALEIHERYSMAREVAMDHTRLGYVASRRGDDVGALAHHRVALARAVEVGLPWTVMLTACGLVEALSATGSHEEACRTIGWIIATGAQHGYPLIPSEQRQVDAARAAAVAALGADVAAAEEHLATLSPAVALL